jgi:agmatine/peptidylarginine deiminase
LSEYSFGPRQAGVELATAIINADARVYIMRRDTSNMDAWFVDEQIPRELREHFWPLKVEHESFWLRDYGPMFVMADGAPLLVDFGYRQDAELDDHASYGIAAALERSLERISVPFDGGNVLIAGDLCLIAEEGEHASSVRQRLTTEVGCAKIIEVPNTAHAHIDMFVKVLSPTTVLVNELKHAQVSSLDNGVFPIEKWRQAAEALDRTAAILRQTFPTVERVPMPIGGANFFLTYTNGILVNGTAILPRYRAAAQFDLVESNDELAVMEHRVAEVFMRHGYRVEFVSANSWIAAGGALHCISIAVPKIAAREPIAQPH